MIKNPQTFFLKYRKWRFFSFSTSCAVLAHLQETLGKVLCFSSFQVFKGAWLTYCTHQLCWWWPHSIKIKHQFKFGLFPLHKSGVNLQRAEGEMPYWNSSLFPISFCGVFLVFVWGWGFFVCFLLYFSLLFCPKSSQSTSWQWQYSYGTLVWNIRAISPDFCVTYQNFLGTPLHQLSLIIHSKAWNNCTFPCVLIS